MKADVSVVIPVRDRRDYVGDAVGSALAQDPAPQEVFVIDDGSSDGTVEFLRSLEGITLIEQPHRGRSAARNVGIRAAQSRFVAFLDSDDVWLPGKLARQLEVIAQNKDLVCTGFAEVISAAGDVDPRATSRFRDALDVTIRNEFDLSHIVSRPAIYTSSLLMSKAILMEIGGFDEELQALEDWDVLIRLARAYRFVGVSWPPIVRYRIHSGNTDAILMARNALRVIHKNRSSRDPKHLQAAFFMSAARSHRSLSEQAAARSTIVAAVRMDPSYAARWGAFRLGIGTLLPSWLTRTLKRQRARRDNKRDLLVPSLGVGSNERKRDDFNISNHEVDS